jgi:hypothetical protein
VKPRQTYLVPLNPEAVLDRVRAATDRDRRSWREAVDPPGDRPFLAAIGHRRFRVRPRRTRRSLHPRMLPALVGQIKPARDGSRIVLVVEEQSVLAWLPLVAVTLAVMALGVLGGRGGAEALLAGPGVSALVLGKAAWDRQSGQPEVTALVAWAKALFEKA